MGIPISKEEPVKEPTQEPTPEPIEDLKEIIKIMKWRMSRLEAENAIMNKTITNLKVSNNEMGRSVAKLCEQVFKAKIEEEGRSLSVRVPKGSRSMFVRRKEPSKNILYEVDDELKL